MLAKEVLDSIKAFGRDYAPQKFDTEEPLKNKVNSKDFSDLVSVWLNKDNIDKGVLQENSFYGGSILMKKNSGFKCSFQVIWGKGNVTSFNLLSMSMSLDYFKNEENMGILWTNCKKLIRICKPVYANISNLSIPEKREAVDLTIIAPELQWKAIFGRPYIDLFSKERILATPCFNIEEIGEDFISIQLQEDVYKAIPKEIREKVKNHLGTAAFVEYGHDFRDYRDKPNLVPMFNFSNLEHP